ncbi:MAG: alcohol dehydrogenase catalytic domain-containing protein [Deltaproteobacteria bacterium]|nr:MAG: alcohol dehydrogenase catalytic domain-containing protein [Deltaproteobacteria bacterium]
MKALQFSINLPQWVILKVLGRISRRIFYQGSLATIKLVDIPEPKLPTTEWVKVKTLMCGFCASDLSLILLKESPTASPFTSFPCIIGHEICGRIVEVGSAVTKVNAGDVVVIAPALNCAVREIDPACPACQQGMVANCENYANGNLAAGMITGLCSETSGGFAPYFVAHQGQVYKLPEGIGPEVGILIEPLTVGLQAVLGNKPQSGEKVLIIGCGVIGTMVLKALRGLKIACVVSVLEPSAFAADLAKTSGADAVISDGDLLGNTVNLTGATRYKPIIGQDLLMGGFNRIYDTVGSPQTLNLAMRCLAAGGTVSQVGIWKEMKLDLTPLWLKQQTLKGVYGCGYATYKGEWMFMFDIALDMVREGKVGLSDMVTHRFSLENFKEMIRVNLDKNKHRAVKTAVSFI